MGHPARATSSAWDGFGAYNLDDAQDIFEHTNDYIRVLGGKCDLAMCNGPKVQEWKIYSEFQFPDNGVDYTYYMVYDEGSYYAYTPSYDNNYGTVP